MKFRDLIFTGALLSSSVSCNSIKNVISTQSRSIVDRQCDNTRASLNAIYLGLEPIYSHSECRIVDLQELSAMAVKSLLLVKKQNDVCVDAMVPLNDLVDPVVDYSKRSLNFVSAIANTMEGAVASGFVSNNEKQIYKNLVLTGLTCVMDLVLAQSKLEHMYVDRYLNLNQVSEIIAKLQNIDNMLNNNNKPLLCTY